MRSGGDAEDRENLADTLATALRLQRHVEGGIHHIEPTKATSVG
jgi:hypothetical protein